jgi:drug/metabolite transporter (DMT)-like permease
MQSHIIGAILALFSAASWSGSDFSGGYASRRHDPYQVLVLGASASVVVLIILTVISHEPFPSPPNVFWSAIAGVLGVLGLAALYLGLSLSSSALVASVAGVIGAALPMVLGILQQGTPTWLQSAGFILAFIGIWQVTQSSHKTGKNSGKGLQLAILAGLCFGTFLCVLSQLEGDDVYGPLLVAKFSSLLVALVFLWRRRLPVPSPVKAPVAILSGAIDAAGNSFFLLATQFTRLDIAAILSNLYPAGTVMLARLVLGERVSKGQWVGVVICLVAIMMVTS